MTKWYLLMVHTIVRFENLLGSGNKVEPQSGYYHTNPDPDPDPFALVSTSAPFQLQPSGPFSALLYPPFSREPTWYALSDDGVSRASNLIGGLVFGWVPSDC